MAPMSLPFSYDKTAAELVQFTYSQPEVRKSFKRYQAKDFCLKVKGMEEYLLENVPLQQYKVRKHHVTIIMYVYYKCWGSLNWL